MRKNHKWLVFLMIGVLVAALSMVSYREILDDIYAINDYYKIFREDGRFYLQLTKYGASFYTGDDGDLLSSGETPRFASVAEIKERMIAGDFTEEEIIQITYYGPGKLIKDCMDFDNLYDAVLPLDTHFRCVMWPGGNYYKLYFASYDDLSGYITSMDSSEFLHYDEYVNKEYYESNIYFTYIFRKSERLSDRNATAYYYSQEVPRGFNDFVDLWYEVTDQSKTLYVQECYELSEYQRNGIPNEINVLGKDGEYFYKIVIEETKKRPTEDWLLSFGLKSYVE